MLKKILKIVAIILLVLFVAYQVLQYTTKKASPEQTVNFEDGTTKISLFYNSPSKKGREIFGALVPYGTVWRTGANEATTFETNKDLTIGGNTLAAGKYTLWTVPNASSWSVIWNKGEYDWGVSWGGVASRDAAKDALEVSVPTIALTDVQESLSLKIGKDSTTNLQIAWDKTLVRVPFDIK